MTLSAEKEEPNINLNILCYGQSILERKRRTKEKLTYFQNILYLVQSSLFPGWGPIISLCILQFNLLEMQDLRGSIIILKQASCTVKSELKRLYKWFLVSYCGLMYHHHHCQKYDHSKYLCYGSIRRIHPFLYFLSRPNFKHPHIVRLKSKRRKEKKKYFYPTTVQNILCCAVLSLRLFTPIKPTFTLYSKISKFLCILVHPNKTRRRYSDINDHFKLYLVLFTVRKS